jgi:hypothetical protein
VCLFLLGWVVIPDLPIHKSAWYLSEEERQHAIVRMGMSRQKSRDLSIFRRVLLSWQFWLLPLIFMRESAGPAPSYTIDHRCIHDHHEMDGKSG